MTVARLNRGRSRFILGIVALVVVVGFVAIFQNNQQENDELRQIGIRCEQQLGAMESQKARMQKSIDTERLEKDGLHQRIKELEEKLKESNRGLESVKQREKLTENQLSDIQVEVEQLKTENTRLKDRYESLQKEKDKEAAALRAKLNAAKQKVGDPAELQELREENERVRKELDILRDKYYARQYTSQNEPVRKSEPSVPQNFNKQEPVSPDVFKLVFSNSSTPTNLITDTNKSKSKLNGAGVNANKLKVITDSGILNSVENFQAIQQAIPNPQQQQQRQQEQNSVLAMPLNVAKSSSSTTTTTESNKVIKKEDNLKAPPILQSPTDKLSSLTTKKQPPPGVAPYPESSLLENNAGVIEEPVEQNAKDDVKNDLMNDSELENLAHEEPDNDFNIDNNDKKSQHDSNDNVNNNIANDNNAEEDTGQYLNENRQMFGNIGKDSGNHNKLNDDKQLKNEVQDDLGKENGDYGDLRLEGQPEDDGDIGEYDDLKAMKVQGPAERN